MKSTGQFENRLQLSLFDKKQLRVEIGCEVVVGKSQVKVNFRIDCIEPIVNELSRIGTTVAKRKPKRAKPN